MSSVQVINADGTVLQTTDNMADCVRMIEKRNVMVMASAWAKRPADERYFGVPDMLEAARTREQLHTTQVVDSRKFTVSAGTNGSSGRLYLNHPSFQAPHLLNNFATLQLTRAIGCNHDFLATLAPTTAAAVLTERLTGEPTALAALVGADKASVDKGGLTAARITTDNDVVVYGASSTSGKGLVRCIASQSYTEIPATSILDRLVDILPQGWVTPPARPAMEDPRNRPATESDVVAWHNVNSGGRVIQIGDMIGPAGAYMSDRDMLLLLVNPSKQVEIDGQILSPYVMLGQGLVNGIRSFFMDGGLLDAVCGNHIMWGCRELFSLKARHTGSADRRVLWTLGQTIARGDRQLPSATSLQERIRQAKGVTFGNDDDTAVEVVRQLCAKKRILLGQRDVASAIELARQAGRYGNPRSAWGVVQGLTELSQVKSNGYQDKRYDLDSAAGDLLDAALS